MLANIATLLILLYPVVLSPGVTAHASVAAADACVDCHSKETPNIVADWQASVHSRNWCQVTHFPISLNVGRPVLHF